MSSDIESVNLTVAIPPRFIGNHNKAVEKKLSSLISRYVPGVDGILIKWTDLSILDHRGTIIDDQPYIFYNVTFNAHLFKPTQGKLLKGKVTRIQKDYFIVNAMDSFNVTVSIPEKYHDHAIVKQVMIEMGIYFKIKSSSAGVHRGEIDEECIELTEELMNRELNDDDERGVYDYANDFEY